MIPVFGVILNFFYFFEQRYTIISCVSKPKLMKVSFFSFKTLEQSFSYFYEKSYRQNDSHGLK